MISETQDLLVLTAPPASGKTYWVTRLKEGLGTEKILFLSPLRALADECLQNWQDTVTVMTPEEWLRKKTFSSVVIIDEFHLFFYWGDTFRPLMWETFYEVTQKASLTILLTATLSPSMKQEISFFSSQFDSMIWLDRGNQRLKFYPEKYIKAPSRNWIMQQIKTQAKGKEVRLIFCRYRQEVRAVSEALVKLGYSCLSCVGGEAKEMKNKLRHTPRPDFIIATTVLSHGVNLPDIRKIFFLYPTENIDFWIQMVARGGRRGLSYQVFSLEKPFSVSWSPFKNFLLVALLTIKQKLSLRSLSF